MELLDGKKTIIGAAFLFTAAFVDQVVMGPINAVYSMPEWVPLIGVVAEWIGMAFAGTGMAHKYIKKRNGGGK
jgi:hypothetical protein